MTWELWAGAAAGVGLAAGSAALAARAALRASPPIGVPVLRYQLVGPPLAGSPLNDHRIPISRFEAQIAHFARRGFRAVRVDEAVAGRKKRRFLASQPLALTFDGPSASFERAAWPILERYGMTRVTLYVPADRLGDKELGFGGGQRPEPLMLPDALAGFARAGVQLGLQSNPRGGATEEGLVARFRAGRQVLGALAGEEITSLATPFSLPIVLRAAKETGFASVVLLGDGILTARTSPHAVPRFAVQPNHTVLDAALVVSRRATDDPVW